MQFAWRITREPRRGFEAVGFSYADAWLEHPDRYALQPGLVLASGAMGGGKLG